MCLVCAGWALACGKRNAVSGQGNGKIPQFFSCPARSVLCSGRQLFFGIIFGLSSGISFGIFVPLAFSFAQISSSHFLFWFSLGGRIPSFFALKKRKKKQD